MCSSMQLPLKPFHVGEALVAKLMKRIGPGALAGITTGTSLPPTGDFDVRDDVALCEITAIDALFPHIATCYSSAPGHTGTPGSYKFDAQSRIDVITKHDAAVGRVALAWEVKLGDTCKTWSSFKNAFLNAGTDFNKKSQPAGKPRQILPIISGSMPIILRDYVQSIGVFSGAKPSDELRCTWNSTSVPLIRGWGLVARQALVDDLLKKKTPRTQGLHYMISFKKLAEEAGRNGFDDTVWDLLGLSRISFYDQWIK